MADFLSAYLPDAVSPLIAALLIVASFFTSAITAAFGLGGGIAMLALLGLFLPVAALVPVHGMVQMGSNMSRVYRMWEFVDLIKFLPFLIGGVVGAALGGSLVISLPDALLKVILGGFIILITWLSLPSAFAASRFALGVGGFVTTALTMFLGATGPLVVALFAHVFSDRQRLLANTALAMSVQHCLKVIIFGVLGFAFAQWLPLIFAMIVTGYFGTIVGVSILRKLDEALFRRIFKIGITLLALDMIRRGLISA